MEARGHELSVHLPKHPVYVDVDPVRMSQVVSNLLNNAAKYTEPGGHIDLAAEVEDGRLHLSVTDDGIGIGADLLPTIFEMFTQGDSSPERRQGGLGVGLALSKRLVELQGGNIEVRSPGPGLGTTLVVTLPTAAPPPAPVQAEESVAAERRPAMRILLVDDNVDFATSLAMLLGELGHEVRVAHEAEAALDAARALHPEVAFLDIGLPGISGYDLARRLRASSVTAETVLIALSGWGQQQDREKSQDAGFAQHLVKPVELGQILAVLDSVVADA